MTDITESAVQPKRSVIKKFAALMLVGSIIAGASFFVTVNRLVTLPVGLTGAADDLPHYVPLPTVIVNLRGSSLGRQLRMTAQVHAAPGYESRMSAMQPTILDFMNGYLGDINSEDLSKPGAIHTVRLQMMYRIEVLVGEGSIKDFLITEFLVN